MSGLSNKDNEDNEEIWKERCMNCIRCNEKTNCGHCWPCRMSKTCELKRCFSAKRMYTEKVKKLADENLKAIMAKAAQREAQAQQASTSTSTAHPSSLSTSSSQQEPVEKKKRGRKKGSGNAALSAAASQQQKKINERDYVPSRPTRQQSADLRRKRTQLNPEPDKQPRQCLNPDCIYEARDESKYCSEECGKILAKMRLTEILPLRCKDYFSSGPAGPRTYEEDVRKRKAAINKDVQELTNAEKHMIHFLEKLHEFVEKQLKNQPLGTEDRYDDNLYESCLVCGLPDIPVRKFQKHIELCWSRSEKAISFGAPEKNNDMFYCEKYDTRTGTYCKRLKSLCPEHRKPGIEHSLKICGYPKKWENEMGDHAKTLSEIIEMDDPFGEEGCRTKKDVCHKHHKWVPSLRGSIELEQACLFQKMFELCHETHKLNAHAEWTTNALSILLHKEPVIEDRSELLKFVKAFQVASPADSSSPCYLSSEASSSSSSAEQPVCTTSISSSADSMSSTSRQDEDMKDTADILASLAVEKNAENSESEPTETI